MVETKLVTLATKNRLPFSSAIAIIGSTLTLLWR
jgi:hypothetical protein